MWLAHPAAQAVSLATAVAQRADDVTLLVGPEGGFTEAEIEQAVAAGARPLTLGASILRIETAAVALIAAFALAASGG
jgi:16S rRNA (uracil1498-N3)-methyltransferase